MRSHPTRRCTLWAAMVLMALAACGREGRGIQENTPLPVTEGESIEAALADTTTALEVRIALLNGIGADGLGIDARIANGEVTLTGEVKRPRSLIMANQLVSSVPGVTAVHNQLSVAPSQPVDRPPEKGRLEGELADELLGARVKLRLYSKVGLDAARIQVFTRGGSVTLAGTLPRRELQTIAVTTAESTPGCVEVVDEIGVRPTQGGGS